LAQEIAASWNPGAGFQLLLGHGSGSFGHVPARQYATRQGVRTPQEWLGFAEVWKQAAALNHLVMDALHMAGIPAISLPASSSVIARAGKVQAWTLFPLENALRANLLPVIFGDVIFDRDWGGTILSTEDLFAYLARQLRPRRLLLAGIENGVWEDYPFRERLISEIIPENVDKLAPSLKGSAAVDVTGGMHTKVMEMIALVQENPSLEVVIFSGEQPGLLKRVLQGEISGTVIHSHRGKPATNDHTHTRMEESR
jgi:isopentenyl phosphate kinase